MKILTKIISLIIFTLILFGCIENDIPFPRIQASFTSMNVEHQAFPPVIDSTTRTIDITLTEEADIKAVKVLDYSFSGESRLVNPDTLDVLDLSTPDTVTVGLYQDYKWTITAVQPISRYFVANGEIGSAVIDVSNSRVIFTFPDNLDLTNVYVDSIKLGQTISTMEPDLNGQYVDFTGGVTVNVTTFGVTVPWHIYANVTNITVFTRSVDAWTNVAWVYGEAEAGKNNGFEYRKADEEEWTSVPEEWITFNGGNMMARLIHLSPETEYVVRAYSDDQNAEILTFTTENIAQLPNSNFADWSQNGKVWQPWGEEQQSYWDTGNRGVTITGESNVTPSDDTPTGKGRAAKLQTIFANILGIGKLGAGSIFAGSFVRTDGTNGILSFGRTFKQRPTKLTGYYKYKTATINYAQTAFEYMKGQPDTCVVWVALIDSEEPFEIRTNPNNRHLFNPYGDEVIAYGILQSGIDVTSYRKFEINLEYNSTSRIPNYILVVASSSKYGDYFTGGTGAEMYLSDIELEYDY